MNLYNLIWLFIVVSFLRSVINRLKHGKHSKHMSRAEYQLYLKSGKWKKKREEVFRYYGKQCVLCGSEENIIVHHRRYDNVTHEPLEDLSCHYVVIAIMLTTHIKESMIEEFKKKKRKLFLFILFK